VRELENVIERAVILSPGPELAPEALSVASARPAASTREPTPGGLARDRRAAPHPGRLEAHQLADRGPEGAARVLNRIEHLRSRMQKLGIRRTVEELS